MTETSRRYITAKATCDRYGGMTTMSLHRWVHNPDMGFPQPLKIGNRNLFDEQELDQFDERQRSKRAAA